MSTCQFCGSKVKKGARTCSRPECNRLRCKLYWRKNIVQQRKRKLADYYRMRESNPQRIREINVRAKNVQRFGIPDRKIILERDQYTCQACGEKSKKLVIHHLDNRGRATKQPNNNLTNLITLCASCHAKHHFGHIKLKI